MQVKCARCESVLGDSWVCTICGFSEVSVATTAKPGEFTHGKIVDHEVVELKANLKKKEEEHTGLVSAYHDLAEIKQAYQKRSVEYGTKLVAMEKAGAKLIRALFLHQEAIGQNDAIASRNGSVLNGSETIRELRHRLKEKDKECEETRICWIASANEALALEDKLEAKDKYLETSEAILKSKDESLYNSSITIRGLHSKLEAMEKAGDKMDALLRVVSGDLSDAVKSDSSLDEDEKNECNDDIQFNYDAATEDFKRLKEEK